MRGGLRTGYRIGRGILVQSARPHCASNLRSHFVSSSWRPRAPLTIAPRLCKVIWQAVGARSIPVSGQGGAARVQGRRGDTTGCVHAAVLRCCGAAVRRCGVRRGPTRDTRACSASRVSSAGCWYTSGGSARSATCSRPASSNSAIELRSTASTAVRDRGISASARALAEKQSATLIRRHVRES